MKDAYRAPKAYRNTEFLNSPEGRTIRILSEFLEPQKRFRAHGVKDTVVFFGSARVLPRAEASKRLKMVKAKTLRHNKLSDTAKKQLADAEVDLEMSNYYEDAAKLAKLLTEWAKGIGDGKRFVVCSGGGPGIMEAANRGARQAGGMTIGLNISLPMEQYANPYLTPDLNFEFHYFFMRKFWFMYLAKGLVMFPGGYGTIDELMEVLTLIQTKKVVKPVPIVLYGKDYWNEVINFDSLLKYRMISGEDLELFHFADTPEEAFKYLKNGLTKHYVNAKR